MGYTQYWERAPEFEPSAFSKAVEEIKIIFEKLTGLGVQLAGPLGHGKPELTDNTIAFNGAKDCGHRYMDLGKPWPAKTAEGINASVDPVAEGEPWFSGPYLSTRACGGNCMGEPFVVDRKHIIRKWERTQNGRYFCYCETSYKPYDLAVTLALMRLRENLGDSIELQSDGNEQAFEDAKRINREMFGWPKRFEVKAPEPAFAFTEE